METIDLREKLAVKHPDTMVTTTKGLMRVGDLERRVTEIENDNELTYIIEYFEKPPIHRSVHHQLKQGIEADGELAEF